MTWLERHFNLVEFSYLAIIAPFVLFPEPASVVLLLGIILLWALRFSLRGHFIPQTVFNLAILLLLLMLLVSQLVSYDLYFGMPKLFGLIWSIAVFFAVVDYAQYFKHRIWYIVTIFVLAGLGLSILALIGTDWSIQKFYGINLVDLLPMLIRGVPGAEVGFNANEVAGTLLWFLPLTCALWLAVIWQISKKNELQPWHFIAVPGLLLLISVELVLLFLLQSRGAIIGLVISLIIILIFAARKRRVLTLGLLGLLVAGTVIVSRVGPTRVYSAIFIQQSTSFEGRLTHWARGLTAIELFPLTGLGLNMYRKIPHVLYPQFLIPQGEELTHTHNMYLQVAVDLGLPALIAYLAILILALFLLLQAWRRGSDMPLKFVVAGCAVALLSHGIYGLLDAVALGARPGVSFWYLLALVASLHTITTGKNRFVVF